MQNKLVTWIKNKTNVVVLLILFIVGYIVLDIISSLILALIFNVFDISFQKTINAVAVFVLFLRGIVFLIYILLFNRIFFNKKETDRVHLENSHRPLHFMIGFVIGIILISIVIFLRYACGFVERIQLLNIPGSLQLMLGNLLITFFTVVVEEFVYRRTIFVALRNSNKSWLRPAIITSLIFSISHIGRRIGIIDLLFFFLFSLLLCLFVENLNSIWIGVGFHLGWNYVSDGGNIFEISYKQELFFQVLSIKLISMVAIILMILVFIKTYKSFSKIVRKRSDVNEC